VDLAYSLAPQANLHHMIGDVKRAIAWIKAHAAAYGIDAGRVVLMGVSGGGHLALLAAYTPHHPAFQPQGLEADTAVRAVVSLYGVTDLVAFFHEYGRANPRQPAYSAQISDDLRPRVYDRTALDRFLARQRIFPPYRYGNMPGGPLLLVDVMGGTLREVPDAYRLGSPIAHVSPQCPPTLQIFGQDDFAIPVSHGQRLHRALCKAGVPSVYVELPDAVHGFDQYFGVSRRVAPAAQAATYDIERFLALMV
jgi:acetyl esterase/lipase